MLPHMTRAPHLGGVTGKGARGLMRCHVPLEKCDSEEVSNIQERKTFARAPRFTTSKFTRALHSWMIVKRSPNNDSCRRTVCAQCKWELPEAICHTWDLCLADSDLLWSQFCITSWPPVRQPNFVACHIEWQNMFSAVSFFCWIKQLHPFRARNTFFQTLQGNQNIYLESVSEWRKKKTKQ